MKACKYCLIVDAYYVYSQCTFSTKYTIVYLFIVVFLIFEIRYGMKKNVYGCCLANMKCGLNCKTKFAQPHGNFETSSAHRFPNRISVAIFEANTSFFKSGSTQTSKMGILLPQKITFIFALASFFENGTCERLLTL